MQIRGCVVALPLLLAASNAYADDVYTLYRSSLLEGISRIHVATFDTRDGDAYNHEDCELAANLFQAQLGVKTRFWCEHGHFHK